MPIHPTAIVDPQAHVDSSADVGPYAVIEADVHVGLRVRIYPHAYIGRYTTLEAGCQVHPFAVVGHLPQDLKFNGAPSYVRVGENTILREHTSVHRGTTPESVTSVGARCFVMADAHIGHNCQVADDVILANGALLGGHVQVGRRAFISGNAVVHQFCRVGELAMVGGALRVVQDVAPFMLYGPNGVSAPNVVGLRRAGFSSDERQEIRLACKLLFRSPGRLQPAIDQFAAVCRTDPGRRLLEFMRTPAKRGYHTLRRRGASPEEGAD